MTMQEYEKIKAQLEQVTRERDAARRALQQEVGAIRGEMLRVTEALDRIERVLDEGVRGDLRQVRGHQELLEGFYRELQGDFKMAMEQAVKAGQVTNMKVGSLVADLRKQNQGLFKQMSLLTDEIKAAVAMRESVAMVLTQLVEVPDLEPQRN
jgi:hypothetical protein